jgi:hypothetical protein
VTTHRTGARHWAVLGALATFVAASLSWRWLTLGSRIAEIQRQLGEDLRPIPGAPPIDPSRRVAASIEANEPLFERALMLASERQVLMWSATAATIRSAARRSVS